MSEINGQKIRQAMLKVIKKISAEDPKSLQTQRILNGTCKELGIDRPDDNIQQAILTLYHDMFRTGILAWGRDFSNDKPPFCHSTEQGRRTLEHLSRDPANPDGYLAQPSLSNINEISKSYVMEALKTYNSDCYKASAVMIGAASESLVLEFRDVIVKEWGTNLSHGNLQKLNHWKIKTVLDGIGKLLDSKKADMPIDLRERYEGHWASFAHQIRLAKNDAGHPKSIKPLTNNRAYSALLIFPEFAELVEDMKVWVKGVGI